MSRDGRPTRRHVSKPNRRSLQQGGAQSPLTSTDKTTNVADAVKTTSDAPESDREHRHNVAAAATAATVADNKRRRQAISRTTVPPRIALRSFCAPSWTFASSKGSSTQFTPKLEVRWELRALWASRTSISRHVTRLSSLPVRGKPDRGLKGKRLIGPAIAWLPPHCQPRDEQCTYSVSFYDGLQHALRTISANSALCTFRVITHPEHRCTALPKVTGHLDSTGLVPMTPIASGAVHRKVKRGRSEK